MCAFLRDLFDRYAKAAAFANTCNLGEALSLLEQEHLAEMDRRQAQALQTAAWKFMHRPRRMPGREHSPAARRRDSGHLLATH